MKFIVAYDIADPARLRLVAKRLEKSAQRVQKSVFLFEGTPRELRLVESDLLTLIDLFEDKIQAWPLVPQSRVRRWDAGVAHPGIVRVSIVAPDQVLLIED